jgi:hypothetical protein
MENVIVSEKAIDFVKAQKHILNPIIVIYRDIAKFGCWYSAKPILFVPKAKVIDELEINEYFTMFNNDYDIRIWVERALLSKLSDNTVFISAKTGLFKGLKLDIGPDLEILKKK